jgi:peroxiredoxin
MSELQGLQLRIDEFRELGAEVMAVCVDPPEQNAEVIARMGLDYAILSDPELEAIGAFGLVHQGAAPDGSTVARPAVYLIEGGKIRWRDLTDNWRVRVHVDELLEAARETFAPNP